MDSKNIKSTLEIPKPFHNPYFRFIKVKAKRKIPVDKNWQTTNNYKWDDPELLLWIRNGGNVGIVGSFGDIVVVDIDNQEVSKQLIKETNTIAIKTGSGNLNFVFKIPNCPLIKQEKNKKEAFSIRGRGGQALIPPSIHPDTGRRYKIYRGKKIEQITLDKLAFILRDWWNFQKSIDIAELLKRVKCGSRNNSAFFLACWLRDAGYKQNQAKNILKKWNNERTELPLKNSEFERTISSAYKKRYTVVFKQTPKFFKLGMDLELKKKINEDFFDKHNKIKHWVVAENLLDKYQIKTLKDTEEILVYKDGIYEENEKLIKSTIQRWFKNKKLSRYDVSEIIGYIQRSTYIDREKFNPKDSIVLANGILRLNPETTIEMHNKNHLATVKMPVEYNPSADCPKIKKFISEVVKIEDIPLIQELIGYCLLKDYRFHKAFMFLGMGANGKSTLLNLIGRLLGNNNISTPSLHKLCNNPFAPTRLYGKLANIHNDIPAIKLYRTGQFKQLVGQDAIEAEKKFIQKTYSFTNYAKLLFSANTLPPSNDTTKAFFRRWIIINFPNIFDEDRADPNLLDKLTTKEELSGLLNWALEGLERLLKQGRFSTSITTEEVKWEWLIQTDSLQAFVKRCVEYDPGQIITKEDFYKAYLEFCDEHDTPPKEKSVVGRQLSTLLPKVESFAPEIDGKRKRAWRGIIITCLEYGRM